MKILTAEDIRRADQITLINEPIASIDLMERAATACFDWITANLQLNQRIIVYCGTGNNGGDGLAIARMLFQRGEDVQVYCIGDIEKSSPDFKINLQRWNKLNKPIHLISAIADLPEHHIADLIVDALFGTGLSRHLSGIAAEVVSHVNQANAEVISIDLPSGMFPEDNADNTLDTIIQATHTLTFQTAKLAFLLADAGEKAGNWHVLNIGLDDDFIQHCKSSYHLIEKSACEAMVKPRKRFSHKGTYGHSLIVAGSKGKIGAAVLATGAALKAGSGLVSSFIPECGYTILQSTVPEAMCFTSQSEDHISGILDWNQFTSIAVGPGIGTHSDTIRTVIHLLENSKKPLVLDADALNIIAAQADLLNLIPKNSILTPHPKEFDRLFGSSASAYARLVKQQTIAKRHNLIIILKGAYTSIACPDGKIYFNSSGNTGMATGGSGDVLTGIIAALLAQAYKPDHAALLGVYFHGDAGDAAMRSILQQSITASDIVTFYIKLGAL
jgi:NAD(P)H-hydrate epimerase